MSTFLEWANNSGYDPKLTLERISNDGGYCPQNCKWSSAHDQFRNRRSNVFLTYKGETLILCDWAKRLNISSNALKFRLKHWDLERAMNQPKQNHTEAK